MWRTPINTGKSSPFTDLWFTIVQQAAVSLDDIAVAIGDRNGAAAAFPLFGEKRAKTVAKQPVKLLAPTRGNSEQDQFRHTGGEALGIGERQRAAP